MVPPYLILSVGTLQWGPPSFTIWFECGNLVTVNDLWSPYLKCNLELSVTLMAPHTLYGMWETCNRVPHMYNMIWIWQPCNCQWPMVPHTLYGMWEHCNWVLPHVWCWNFVTVNDLWSPCTLYGMREPCNCQWVLVPPYLIWNAGTL